MNVWRKIVLAVVMAAAVSTAPVAVAHADYIDYGVNQAGCKSAAQAANAAGYSGSFCYETGPGHYSLYIDN